MEAFELGIIIGRSLRIIITLFLGYLFGKWLFDKVKEKLKIKKSQN